MEITCNSYCSLLLSVVLFISFMRDKLKPVVKTEEQFLFVCHLVGPFFQRFHIERTRCMLDVCYLRMLTC